MEEKITVNGVPLKAHLEMVWTSEAGLEFQMSSRKYWNNKSKVKFTGHKHERNGKVRQLEEWEIFVHQLDKIGRDIADMSIGQLSKAWKAWKKERTVW